MIEEDLFETSTQYKTWSFRSQSELDDFRTKTYESHAKRYADGSAQLPTLQQTIDLERFYSHKAERIAKSLNIPYTIRVGHMCIYFLFYFYFYDDEMFLNLIITRQRPSLSSRGSTSPTAL